MKTEISEVKIIPLKPKDGLVALASCVLDGKLYLGSIGVYTKRAGGYRLTYPTKKTGERSVNLYHPINKDTGDDIESAIISEYEKVIAYDTENI